MAAVLYLTHRMPFPPDKGDKITTYNFLRHLSSKHEVCLGAFVDADSDWAHVEPLKAYCAEVKLIGIRPPVRRMFSARALLTGDSISETYHRSDALQRWVDEITTRRGIRTGLAYCSAMAPFLVGAAHRGMRRVAHYADVDSAKWHAYADKHDGLMARLYRREARTLQSMERRLSREFDITSFVSEADAALYRQLAPESAEKVRVIPNGVDTEYFNPDLVSASPYDPEAKAIVFTGAMDYWPNGDAVVWFAKEVFPRILANEPSAEFWIVGSRPSADVVALARYPGVHVTGRVPDVRPYIAHAGAVVAPLRVARGVQNKVLEAYAMARNVVLTSASANGLHPAAFTAAQTHDAPEAQAAAVLQALVRPARFDEARQYVIEGYSWQYAFSRLDEALR